MQRSERSATGGKKNTKTEGGAQSLYVISPLSECCFVFLPTFLYHVPKFKHVSYIPKSGSSPLSQQNFHFGELSVEKVKRPKKKKPLSHICRHPQILFHFVFHALGWLHRHHFQL